MISRQQHKSQTSTGLVFPVVGVVASAGDLDSLLLFLRNLPRNTGMAFVCIVPQRWGQGRSMTELLSKATVLPVADAVDGWVLRRDYLYILPADAVMAIEKGVFRLKSPRSKATQDRPIDFFFKSLAEDLKNKAIGVTLSRISADGIEGLKAIKAVGGTTIAQNARGAEFEMSSTSVSPKAVDHILPAGDIPKTLVRIASKPDLDLHELKVLPSMHAPTNPYFQEILRLLKNVSKLDFSYYKQVAIQQRLSDRMLLHKFNDLKQYFTYLRRQPEEVKVLSENIQLHTTKFFRDPELFDILKKHTFPKIIEASGARPIRIWVPQCSSGEEPYSLAISLLEVLSSGPDTSGRSIQVFGTDINESAIEKAREGLYGSGITADVTPERLSRFFNKTEEGYRINDLVRHLCVFACHDVVKEPPFAKIDLLSCRDLLISFGAIVQKRVVPVFRYSLTRNGFLIVGDSEKIGAFSEYFHPVDKEHKIYSKGPSAPQILLNFGEDSPEQHKENILSPPKVSFHREVLEQAHDILLSRYAPASILVNRNMEIIESRDQVGSFVRSTPEKANINLLKLAREGLADELIAAIEEADREKTPIRKEGLNVRNNQDLKMFSFEVIPLFSSSGSLSYFLILFEKMTSFTGPRLKKKIGKKVHKRRTDNEEVLRQRREIAGLKEYFQSIVEEQEVVNRELKSANEEILSKCEELRSANLKLKIAKEQLQRSNEELNIQNIELNDVNEDLNNLLPFIEAPLVMLSCDLRLRCFTPAAGRILHLIPAYIGQSITNLDFLIDVLDLGKLILRTIHTGEAQEGSLNNNGSQSLIIKILPCKALDNQVTGVVLHIT